ncbi:hypothetical protein B9W62_07195 [Streptomyces sp. CS113]|uniref:hypothetical protein n=1 Tax=Streptomyces sp. CS113 TaxID=1982761 RepID=UPI000B416614|nr:hypothetical protein [Streptomyces sp. CS113]OWA11841.1 hypothetical protein B9W62_07195 [Streptomyces sp. CS113]
MIQSMVHGGAAGVASTTVRNAVTYADTVRRGRSAREVPAQVVARLAAEEAVHPGTVRDNRLTGPGALSAIAVGCGAGATVSMPRRTGARMPVWLSGLVTAVEHRS